MLALFIILLNLFRKPKKNWFTIPDVFINHTIMFQFETPLIQKWANNEHLLSVDSPTAPVPIS